MAEGNIDIRMEEDASKLSRRSTLNEAVTNTVSAVFDNLQVREFFAFSSQEPDPVAKQKSAEDVSQYLTASVQKMVRAHLDQWISNNRLEKTFEAVDEHCLRSEPIFSGNDSTIPNLATPRTSFPNEKYEEAKLVSKKQQLESLEKELAGRQQETESLKSELSKLVENSTALKTKLNGQGTPTTPTVVTEI